MKDFMRLLRKAASDQRLRKESSAPHARQMVFDLIERTPQSAAAERVERILELLVAAEECRVAIFRDGLKGGLGNEGDVLIEEAERRHRPLKGFHCAMPLYRFADEALEERNRQYRALLRELQTQLIRYQWRPTVEDRLYTSLGRKMLWDRTDSAETKENIAVQFLLEQIDGLNGPARILRFRKCRECARWFYAVKDHQIYCGESCRKRYASHNPEFKKKRAEYMRDNYRPLQKKLDAQNLPEAGRLAKGKSK